MRIKDILRIRLRTLAAREVVEQELDEELRYHADRQTEEFIAAGMSPREARDAAYRAMADVELRKEECRDTRGWNMIDNLTGDAKYALRQLHTNLGFAGTAILILASGICASLSIFAFVDAALLKPLPYRDPTRLMAVYEKVELFERSNLSWQDYEDWKKMNVTFQSLDVFRQTGYLLQNSSGVEPARGARVSAGFFRTLGVKPVLGRDFVDGEDTPGAARTAILSYSTWQTRYGGRKNIVGQTITLDREPTVITGVLPAEFHFAPVNAPEYWTPFHVTSGCETRRGCHSIYGVGRLKDGVSEQAALANLVAVAQQLEKQYPDSNRGQGANLTPLSEAISGDLKNILLVLLAGAGLLLVIAYVNVTGLLLVRSESRRREIAVRAAMGASSVRLVTQFVTEAVLLAGAGTVLGLFGAHWTMKLLMGLLSESMLARMPFLMGLGLNGRVLAFGAAVSVIALAVCALAPSLRLGSAGIRTELAEGGRGAAGVGWRQLGSKLVILELATAMVLLVSAGLLGKSLYILLNVDVGIQPDHLVAIDVMAQRNDYATEEQQINLARSVMANVEKLPGVTAVGFSSSGIPLGGNGNTTWFRVLGRPYNGEHEEVAQRDVSAGYFMALGAKLIRGRQFSEAEDKSKPRVVIINESFVRKYFRNEEPLGRHVSYLSTPPVPMEIVGIVEDIREGPLDADIPPVMYRPFNQSTDDSFSLVVRTSQAEAALIPAIAASLKKLDGRLVTSRGTTMKERIQDSPSAYLHRTSAWIVAGFASLAMLLGVVGLYGVVAYSVGQRTREIGVRMALGAEPNSVYRLILGEAGWLTGIGIVLGLVLSVAAASAMRGLLFGVRSWDVPTLASVAVVLALAALAASFIPARRAAGINPVEALRAE
jgi:macrolide transport system ATP-binding/permease protein